MKYRTLGQTGLEVSEIGLGAFPISGKQQRADGSIEVWSGTSDTESIALIHRCEELGVNLIDSAEGYGDGHSEELVGRALQRRRDKWIIATKVQPNRDIDQNDEQIGTQPDCRSMRKQLKTHANGFYRHLSTARDSARMGHARRHVQEGLKNCPSPRKIATQKIEGKIRCHRSHTKNYTAPCPSRRNWHSGMDWVTVVSYLLQTGS